MLQLGSLQPSRFFQSLHLCLQDFFSVMTPMEILALYASCREAHALTDADADAVAAAHFANSRWYRAPDSICVWRSIWQQCVVAAQARGWNANVWEHAEMLIEGRNTSEFDDSSYFLSSECDFHELCVPRSENRHTVVDGLEEYLILKTGMEREVRGILALFLFKESLGYYWSFMLALDDHTFVAWNANWPIRSVH